MLKFFRMIFVFLSWALPLGLMLVGWFFFLPLRDPVSFSAAPSAEIYRGLFVLTLLTVAWVVSDWFTAMRYTTSGRELQVEAFISTLAGVILTFVAGWLLGEGNLPWYFVIPWCGALVDTFMTQYTAINNAIQKPLMHRVPHGG